MMDDKDIRLECLKTAGLYASRHGVNSPEKILELAEKFEQYVFARPSPSKGGGGGSHKPRRPRSLKDEADNS